MRRRDETTLTMANVVMGVMDAGKQTWSTDPPGPIDEIVTAIKNSISAISAARQGAGTAVSTGVTKDKGHAADDAIDMAVELARYVRVYATRNNNSTLADQMKAVKRKTLEDMDDDSLPDALDDLYDRISGLGNAVIPYGATKARLDELKADIDRYRPQKDAPRATIIARKGANSLIPDEVKAIRSELRDLDVLMEQFADEAPKLYTDYTNARIEVGRGGGQGGSANSGAQPQG